MMHKNPRGNGYVADLTGVLEPYTILPGQYFSNSGNSTEPEKRLLLAILENAVEIYQKYIFDDSRRGRQLFKDVELWMEGGYSDDSFAFDVACEGLGLDAGYIRTGLLAWKNTQRRLALSGVPLSEPLRNRRRIDVGRRHKIVLPRECI